VGKLVLGSVAERIFQTVLCPVLTVGRRARKSWGADEKLSRIVYATSFSDASLASLPYALSLAKASGAELSLVHAMEPTATAAEQPPAAALHEHLNALIPPEVRDWLRYDTFVIPGDAAEVIVNLAGDQGADFIVMAGHRVEGPLYTLEVPRTIAYRVVSRALCPVLRVRS
jgi:nucleotide-binding universal stress UspA family protein